MKKQLIQMYQQENHVDMADICELAHILTARECKKRGIQLEYKRPIHGELNYTSKAQKIYDYYYDTITNTLNV